MRMISTRVEERGAFPLISPREKNASFNKSNNAKARRIQLDSGDALYPFVFAHVVIPKPVPTFGRHAVGGAEKLRL